MLSTRDLAPQLVVELAERLRDVVLRVRVRPHRVREVAPPHEVIEREQVPHLHDGRVSDHPEERVLEDVLRGLCFSSTSNQSLNSW